MPGALPGGERRAWSRARPTCARKAGETSSAWRRRQRVRSLSSAAARSAGELSESSRSRTESGWCGSAEGARTDRGPTRSQQRRSIAAQAPLTRGPIRIRRPSRSEAVRERAAQSPLCALHRSQHAAHQQRQGVASLAAGRGRAPPERVGAPFLRRHACSCAPWRIHASRRAFRTTGAARGWIVSAGSRPSVLALTVGLSLLDACQALRRRSWSDVPGLRAFSP